MLSGREAIIRFVRPVAQEQSVGEQLCFDRRNGSEHARVRVLQVANLRELQQRRVDTARTVVLRVAAPFLVEPLELNLLADGVAQPCPSICRTGESVLAHCLDSAVESRPQHGARVRELPLWSAHFPHAVVESLPVLLDEAKERSLQRPGELILFDTEGAGPFQGEHGLAKDVGLVLGECTVSSAHRRCPVIAGQAVNGGFGQIALTAKSIHDLDVARVAGDRPEQPVSPRECFFVESAREQNIQGGRGVAQPHVPVIPIPHTTPLFGEAGGCRRGDPSGVFVGKRAQYEQ